MQLDPRRTRAWRDDSRQLVELPGATAGHVGSVGRVYLGRAQAETRSAGTYLSGKCKVKPDDAELNLSIYEATGET